MVTSQGTQVGAARVVESVEEERNVTIVLPVVARECSRSRNRGSRQRNGQRLFRQDTE